MDRNLKLALVGRNVSASPSPRLHGFIMKTLGAACGYEKISLTEAEFSSRIEGLFSAYDGLNVTAPYKRAIMPYLTRLEGDAEAFGSVNTVLTCRRLGFNTDGGGFSMMLQTEGIGCLGKRALVLGAGGAGRSCIKTLLKSGAEVFVYEKDSARLAEVLNLLGIFTPLGTIGKERFDLIVNCTGVGMNESVGMLPSVRTPEGERPFCKEFFTGCESAVDLIYAPACSAFLETAKRSGAKTVNGWGMLFFQAYFSDCIFLGRAPDADEAVWIKKKYEEEVQ